MSEDDLNIDPKKKNPKHGKRGPDKRPRKRKKETVTDGPKLGNVETLKKVNTPQPVPNQAVKPISFDDFSNKKEIKPGEVEITQETYQQMGEMLVMLPAYVLNAFFIEAYEFNVCEKDRKWIGNMIGTILPKYVSMTEWMPMAIVALGLMSIYLPQVPIAIEAKKRLKAKQLAEKNTEEKDKRELSPQVSG